MTTSEETGDEGVRITETDTRAGWEPLKTGYTAEQAAADRAARAREETEAMGERPIINREDFMQRYLPEALEQEHRERKAREPRSKIESEVVDA